MTVALGVSLTMVAVAQDGGQQPLPDSPAPQLQGVGPVTPGKGTPQVLPSSSDNDNAGAGAPATSLTPAQTAPAPAQGPADSFQKQAPDLQTVPQAGTKVYTLPQVSVNFVDIPFTVKDNHGNLVPGLTWRDVRVYENGVRQQMRLFTVDPAPLSVALVVDQSMPFSVMDRVNTALGAITGAFTPYDEMAVFTYNNGPRMQTNFTGAQSPRLTAVLERSKTGGREANMAMGGPMSVTTYINGHDFDPNTSAVRNHDSTFLTVPKEVHTLNDAIFAAAQSLADRPKGRRRIIYVVSDGKEQGSKVNSKQVIRYLQTNKISVYATLVGDSATWGIGFLDKYNIPLQMRDNILPQYVNATGGQAVSEYREKAIENSFAKIAEEVRTQYTVGYYSHENLLDGKYRSIEVQVLRSNLNVIAKKGYYPTPGDLRPSRSVDARAPAGSTQPAQ